MTTINPGFSLTAEDLALLGGEQFEKLRGAAGRLQQLLAADEQRRLAEAFSGYDVLGKDAAATPEATALDSRGGMVDPLG
jgi:hypothetical protein